MRSNSLLLKQKASRYSLMFREFQHLFVESSQPMLHYVVPQNGWSSDWTGYYITRRMQKLGMKAQLSDKPPRVKGDIVHFADTASLLHHIGSRSNDHNWLVATIFHGDDTDEFPEIEEVIKYSEDLNRVVVTNEVMFKRFTEWGVREDKLIFIPLGVDLNSFFPASVEERASLRQKFAIPEEAFCIGSFQKDGLGWGDGDQPDFAKGPDVFLEAVDKLSGKISNLHVLLTGPARGYVKQGLDRIGVSYSHHMIDPYQEIRDCYACLDSYVITSREDGGPNALLESMACGVPVVSTRMGMAADVIEDPLNGLLADVEDSNGIANKVLEIFGDEDLVSKLAVMGVDTAHEYDWSTISALYFEHVYAPLMVQRYS
ncbi:MAG: glycosyltransferase family 4 protein [Methyloligellaceae bacterium]